MNNDNKSMPLTLDKGAIEIISKWLEKEKNGDLGARKKAEISFKNFLIKTDDGSYTLNSNEFLEDSETMHSYHGAITESLEKFVKPAKLEGKRHVQILDMCSGLGYNAASCIEYLDNKKKIDVDMVEISRETVAAALLIENPVKSFEIIKSFVEDMLYKEGFLSYKSHEIAISDKINIDLHIEDGRRTVEKLENKKQYDAIFLDPFSPLKCPELYSLEFFLKLKNLLKNDGIILTYTSAAPVRSAVVLSDLHVGEGPEFMRSGGTIASKKSKAIDVPLSCNDERMIALSDAGIPFRDPNLTGLSKEILYKRKNERESVRGSEKFASTVKTPQYLCKEIKDPRTKRRVLKNVNLLGIESLESKKAAYIICPQFEGCICNCGIGKLNNSKDRINEMCKRLDVITENNKN